MAKGKLRRSWLQGLLLVVGAAFCITALAYCVMMVRADRASRGPSTAAAGAGIDQLINKHGQTALLVELGLLAVLTGIVIWKDDAPVKK